MFYDAYFGELPESRKLMWKQESTNPYKVLNNGIEVTRGAHEIFWNGKEYFRDRVQVDWGSFIFRCNEEEIKLIMNEKGVTFAKKPIFEKGKEYGIIVIETGFSGEDLYE